jgi:alpha-beta hydrolase superfamily lysophospholipase
MKAPPLFRRYRCPVGTFLCVWGLSISAAAIDFAFQDPAFSFQSVRALGYAVSGGADIGEVLHTVHRITEGDDESWHQEWVQTAQARETVAEQFLAAGHNESARQEFLRAAAYYRTAEFFLHTNTNDPRIVSTSKDGRDCFHKAAALSPTPIRPVEIPFEDTTLPGTLCLVDESGAKRPLLIVHSGFDGTAEELYFSTAFFALQRGYNVLLFEGPGQGRVLREQGIPFRPNWESVVTPVVDFALTLPDVDPDQVVLMGLSFGGYLAPRAAAFEHRLRACIANGGVFDFHEVARLSPEDEAALESPEGCQAIDAAMEARMKTDPAFRWSIANGLFTFHAATPSDWLKMTRAYSLKEVARQITCPVLVCDSAGDRNMAGQAKELYAALTCPKTFLLFTQEEGAEEHCQMGAIHVSTERIFNWLDDTLTRKQEEPK